VLAILVPFALTGLRHKLPGLTPKHWKILAALGFTGGGLHLALQWLGLHYTTATSGILYLSTSPIFILLMAAPVARERIVPRQWIGVAISFGGVAIIATQGNFKSVRFNSGDLMALASMVMWAGYTVFLRVRRDPLSTSELLVMVCAFGAMFMAPWVMWEMLFNPKLNLNLAGSLGVLYSAIGSLLLGEYPRWFHFAGIALILAGVALSSLKASSASNTR
jgi:drug/metabolite transporter (DMT)-like permease